MTSPYEEVGDKSYRAKFDRTVPIAALRVSPKKAVGAVLKRLHGKVYCQRGVRNVADASAAEDAKLILLDPSACDPAATTLPESIASLLDGVEGGVSALTLVPGHTVQLSHKNFTMPEMLAELLPKNCVAISGFEQVGHIAHVNLSADNLPYKFIIGQVLIDCNPSVTLVVNKVDTITSVFREFKMEVIGGSTDPSLLVAEVRQHGFVFRVPYDKVYWNSRLSAEHDRLVAKLRAGDELFDVMAGIGPFAIPAAHQGVIVHANDLNPASYDALKENAKANGVAEKITAYNMDGRDFIDNVVRAQFLEKGPLPDGRRRHLTMNLPDLAVTFLDVFTRPSFRTGKVVDQGAIIHVYTFSAAPKGEVLDDALRQVEGVLQCAVPREYVEELFLVRDVAPKKQMVCVSFRLPPAIFASEEVPQAKRDRKEHHS